MGLQARSTCCALNSTWKQLVWFIGLFLSVCSANPPSPPPPPPWRTLHAFCWHSNYTMRMLFDLDDIPPPPRAYVCHFHNKHELCLAACACWFYSTVIKPSSSSYSSGSSLPRTSLPENQDVSLIFFRRWPWIHPWLPSTPRRRRTVPSSRSQPTNHPHPIR